MEGISKYLESRNENYDENFEMKNWDFWWKYNWFEIIFLPLFYNKTR